MLIAVLSDIHSNPDALLAVLVDAERSGARQIWLLGDTFGYHPWAARTFELIAPHAGIAVLGNHDGWVLAPDSAPTPLMRELARHNHTDLERHAPTALQWVASLPRKLTLEREGWTITLAHGTPSAPLDGRHYPDDDQPHPWLPGDGEMVLLGQTHHPINRGCAGGGLLLNPGSVGQPRDGDPRPAWALLDLGAGTAQLRRTHYDRPRTIERLRRASWDASVVATLAR